MKNRDRRRGFFVGVLTAAVALGLVISALAARQTAGKEEEVRLSVNGVRLIPRDARGNELDVFVRDGAVYGPIREVCEAVGLDVTWSEGESTLRVTTPADPGRDAAAPAADLLTTEEAKAAALKHAGVGAADAVFLKAELDREDGRLEYEIKFTSGGTEYEYDLDAATGAVLKWERETIRRPGVSETPAPAAELLTAGEAEAIALAKAPAGAVVVKCELDRDDGRYVYELELRLDYTEYECELDAADGTVLKWEVD